jgi:hypothetical protein
MCSYIKRADLHRQTYIHTARLQMNIKIHTHKYIHTANLTPRLVVSGLHANVCMYVYAYVYKYTNIHMQVNIKTIYTHMNTYIQLISPPGWGRIRATCQCVYVCVCMCMFVCMYVYAYVYIHKHTHASEHKTIYTHMNTYIQLILTPG